MTITKPTPRHPEVEVQLTGEDGNVFLVLGRVSRALKRAGYEDEVREFFAPYEGWTGLAGAHALRSARQITPRSPLPAAGRSAGRPAVRAA